MDQFVKRELGFRHYGRYVDDFYIIDESLSRLMSAKEAVAFFNLINILHEKASVIITTNKAPTEWVSILQDEVLATALLDRLLYRCDVVKLSGTSYRMENRSGFLGKPAEKKEDRK